MIPKEHIRWWQNAIIYEAYVDKFAGNFKNFTQQLWYLEKLGVTCIHLLPHYPSPMVDEGYDVSDYCAVREDLGTLEDFSVFAAEAKRRGMRIIIDLVLNHTSDFVDVPLDRPGFDVIRGESWMEAVRVGPADLAIIRSGSPGEDNADPPSR